MRISNLGSVLKRIGRRKSDAGTAALELGLVLPVMAILVVGAADFARLFYTAIEVANAARAGVQYGVQSNGATGNSAGMQKAAADDAKQVSGMTVTAARRCQCADGAPADCLIGDCGSYGAPQIYVTVTAQKNFDTVIPYPGIPPSINLTKTAIMRAQ